MSKKTSRIWSGDLNKWLKSMCLGRHLRITWRRISSLHSYTHQSFSFLWISLQSILHELWFLLSVRIYYHNRIINTRNYPKQPLKQEFTSLHPFQYFKNLWKLCIVFIQKELRNKIQQIFSVSFGFSLVHLAFTGQLRAVWGHHAS